VVPPKIFSDYDAAPGQAPRPLLVERKRREYAAKLARLPELVAAYARPGTMGTTSFLELEHFDDVDFDVRSPESWVDLGQGGGGEGNGGGTCHLPALALCRTKYPSKVEDMAFEEVRHIRH
jgi:hypothetical protein